MPPVQPAASPAPHELLLEPAGWRLPVPEGTSLLAAAREAGIRLPSSCRNGTCRACMCRLQRGSVSYSIAWPGLSAEEKQQGWILPCVAHARSDLVLEVPHATRIPTA
ncbi:2Fe-2S iron-sulfur cluster-binding protein [Eleftheria terrae]|uniref:2Fe-2S iron-sulfur cluster-binding protein n=1 Tax=Eleftheria terrae TaxID=1597781 RepID=UPI00263A89F4|nr:2Fe-2S iron-sulfur cluster binding domain-containing protein [Eleftheria terrae]WKB52504.1 2Fe-2S iron-sulfur cluster binding domain-containing protein [Eleftheria terrae]